jgi:Family of unknown function (DUF5689)/Secretion system C-terminal sorting domain
MINSTKLLFVFYSFIVFSTINVNAQTLTQWRFDGQITPSVVPTNGTASSAVWSTGTTTFPAGKTGNSGDNALSTTGFNTTALNPAKYLEFTITPNANYAMVLNSVSFYDQKSGTGPTNWVLRSSLDGYVADLNSPSPSVTNTLFNATPNLVELGINFQNINTAVTFRLYAYGGTSAAGTWRLDDLTIEGSLFNVSNPIINASKQTIAFQTILTGTPSVFRSFIVAGFGLTGDLTVSVPTGYEISNSESSGYTNTLSFPQSGGRVVSKVIYVRLSGVVAGVFNRNITLSSPNVPTKTIVLTGTVVNLPNRTSIATVRNQPNNTNIFTGGRVTVSTQFSPNQIFIQDNSGGISVFNPAKNIAVEYGLQLGDSVEIFGFTGDFNGLNQINLLNLTKINTPQYIPVPSVINASELATHEGELVTIQNVSFPGTGGNYAANTNYPFGFMPVRILSTNASNNIVGTPIQAATGQITGIVGVFNGNYQLYPRFTTDFNSTGLPITDANFQDNSALTIATWNVEWFGHPTLGPTDNALQATNVATVLNTLKADIYEVEEVSDSVGFQALVAQMSGYSCKCSSEYSYSNVAPVDPFGQRVCFVYKNSVFSNVTTTPLLTNLKYDTALVVNYPNNKSRFWASGRLPFLMTANVTINGKMQFMGFVGIHARANTGSTTAISQEIYDMRKYDVEKLKAELDANYPNLPFILSGDFNDDLDETVAFIGTNKTSFEAYKNDAINYNLFTLALSKAGAKSTAGFADMIDHITGSNELNNSFLTARVGSPQTYISSYTTTTTDHYPVMAKFNLSGLTIPVELLYFSGQLIDKQVVRLDWATSSEINADYFSIEHSTNGKEFIDVGNIKSVGNSSKKTTYLFNDSLITELNKTLYYRLKQVDYNGAIKYSKIIAINNLINKNAPIKVYPNPANNTIFVKNINAFKSINIYNSQGVLIKKSLINEVDISAISSGIYLLEVENTEGVLNRVRFVKL